MTVNLEVPNNLASQVNDFIKHLENTYIESGYLDLERYLTHELAENFSLFCMKQRDYGPENINAFGEYGVLVRLSDKVERLKHCYMVQNHQTVNESIEDTWRDISIYALIALLVRKGLWPNATNSHTISNSS